MPSPSRKPRRPKPGTGFLLVRLIGLFLKIIGGLLTVSALSSLIIMLVKTGPLLAEALQFPEQKMAGFIVLILLGGLSVFVLLGLGGVISLGLGFVCSYWGTEPAGVSLTPSATASTSA